MNSSENIHSHKENLSLEDRQKLISVFAWLIEEDKKQNPALYQSKKTIHD